LPNTWAIHQLLTTVDIVAENRLAHFLLGGLNANVIHHIYPVIHHCHLIPLVKILNETAKEFNSPYKSYSYIHALQLHFSFLKRMGKSNT